MSNTALSVDANEKMKARYYDGHKKPQSVPVNADLSLKELDLSGVDWATGLSPALLKLVDSSG